MIRTLDGPAQGQVFRLARAPIYLRFVFDGSAWDGLDQIGDTPRENETVYAYIRVADHGMVHINSRDRKTGKHNGGFFSHAEYRIIDPQPPIEVLSDNELWREWTHAEHERNKPAADRPAGQE